MADLSYDDDVNYRHLPGVLGVLARHGFSAEALVLASQMGGTKQRIPFHPTKKHHLVKVIGLEAAKVLAEEAAGWHDIPQATGLRTLKQRIMRQKGGTREIARALGTSERYVRHVKALVAAPINDGQLSLFSTLK